MQDWPWRHHLPVAAVVAAAGEVAIGFAVAAGPGD